MCICAEEEARFHEVTISLSVERATGVGRVSGVISRRVSWIHDAFGPRHSCQTGATPPTPKRWIPLRRISVRGEEP